MPRSKEGKKSERERQVCFQMPESEHEILENACKEQARTKTDILRELVRSLKPRKKASEQK